jgi:hypothetical protein
VISRPSPHSCAIRHFRDIMDYYVFALFSLFIVVCLAWRTLSL